jgi:hypothetical protein
LAYLSELVFPPSPGAMLVHRSALTIFMFSSDAPIFPASDISLSASSQTRCTCDTKVTGRGSGFSNKVYQRMRALARVTTAASAPLAVLRRDLGSGKMSSWRGVLDSRVGLELLTPDAVVLWLVSGDETRPTLDDGNTGGVYDLPGIIRPPAARVRLTSPVSCDPEVVETRTVDTRLFARLSAVRDRWRSSD